MNDRPTLNELKRRLRLRDRPWVWKALDAATAAPTALAAAHLSLVRRLGVRELPTNRAVLRSIGLLPVPHHYYEPFITPRDLLSDLDEPRTIPGLAIDDDAAWTLLETLLSDHGGKPLVDDADADFLRYDSSNGTYGLADARVLHAIVHHLRPRRVLEVGSGNSTLAARAALRQLNDGAKHVCIEPYEMPWLEKSGVEVLRKRVELIGMEPFQTLESGDILFIDNSHIIRPQGDVLFLFQQVVPRLASGVWVHVHDIFTPRDYPAHWLFDKMLLWNEQYLLEMLLANGRYEILLPLNHLFRSDQERFGRATGEVSGMSPTGFWFRVK
jgi:hypothetical protein